MTQHTPGPWRWRNSSFAMADYFQVEPVPEPAEDADESDPNQWWADQVCSHIEREEDARLIAAAPDMLTALEKIASLCEIGQEFSGAAQNALNIARTAIAKATGEDK